MVERCKPERRGFWKFLTLAVLGLGVLCSLAQPAEAARGRGRGWGRGVYRAYRAPYRGYGYYGGYRGYRSGYSGYSGRWVTQRPVYPGTSYGGPYQYGYRYSAPLAPAAGYGSSYYNFAPRMWW
jgi:hypothetical protein